jgi:DNA gyrase subunit A
VNRQHVSDIRLTGRNTSGVKLIRLMAGDLISALARVPKSDEETDSEVLLEDPDGQMPLSFE